MPHRIGNFFHLHLVSDATGETLLTVARAAAAQYTSVTPVEHMHPLVRTRKQLDRGRLVTELMKQPQYHPLAVWEMAVTLFAVNNGYFDGIEIAKALENYHDFFIQTFAGFFNTPEQMQKLFQTAANGPASSTLRDPYEVHYFRTRDEYVNRGSFRPTCASPTAPQ